MGGGIIIFFILFIGEVIEVGEVKELVLGFLGGEGWGRDGFLEICCSF